MEQMPVVELTKEQKTVFAQSLLDNPSDFIQNFARHISKEVVDRWPIAVISAANSALYDKEILAEKERLKLILPEMEFYIRDIYTRITQPGTQKKDYIAGMKLILEARGMMNKSSEDSSQKGSQDRSAELAAMVVDSVIPTM